MLTGSSCLKHWFVVGTNCQNGKITLPWKFCGVSRDAVMFPLLIPLPSLSIRSFGLLSVYLFLYIYCGPINVGSEVCLWSCLTTNEVSWWENKSAVNTNNFLTGLNWITCIYLWQEVIAFNQPCILSYLLPRQIYFSQSHHMVCNHD